MKSKLLIFLIIICILFTTACVSAADNQTEVILDSYDYHSFKELNQSISSSTGELNLQHDYKYDGGAVIIEKENRFVINGNNHVIDGINDSESFNINSKGVVIFKDMTFQNCREATVKVDSPVIFSNVTFKNCSSKNETVFIEAENNVQFDGCTFMGNHVYNTFVAVNFGNAIVKNSIFNGGDYAKGAVYADRVGLMVENCTFSNISSNMATAFNYKGWNLTVKNSRFLNLKSRLSAGAFMAKFFPNKQNGTLNPFLIESCEFVNITSTSNGGAIYCDLDSGSGYVLQSMNLINLNFTNCKSKYGGAICNLGGILNIVNSSLTNNSAGFEGGAIYTSWCRLNIADSILTNNTAEKNAGAIYFDKGRMSIKKSSLIGNVISTESADAGRVIYAQDSGLDFSNSTFDNGGLSVYGNFMGECSFENLTRNNDAFSLDNKNYIFSVEGEAIRINLTNNSMNVGKLPSRYDSRDWGWVSPGKEQGDNDDCWAFATVASLESALLKSTGVLYNLSANYVQKLQLKYFENGDLRISSTGFSYSGLGHALSWYGTLEMDNGYDERGMIVDTDFSDKRIHLQDAMIIFGGKIDSIGLIKQAILKYGSVSIQLFFLNKSVDVNTTEKTFPYLTMEPISFP